MKIVKTRKGKPCRIYNGKRYVMTEGGYYRSTTRPQTTLAHDIWVRWHGKIPEGKVVVHRNGKKADDRKGNLLILTRSQASHFWQMYYAKRKPVFEPSYKYKMVDFGVPKSYRRSAGYWDSHPEDRKARWKGYKNLSRERTLRHISRWKRNQERYDKGDS